VISQFFIDRPVFATVLSLVIVIVGGIAAVSLPVGQYPDVVPPTISIQTIYPGASAQVVADTVTTPIEQEVNGVEEMLFISSKSTGDGQAVIDVTFKLGTDIDLAQVLTQNRVAIAEAKLPEEVKRQGVMTKKKSPSILLCVNLFSPDGRYDQLYLSNYALIQVKDALARLEGVGDVAFLGARDYAMRIWLDPDKLATRNLAAGDVVRALREQNVQVPAGRLGQPPAESGIAFQVPLNTTGRLLEPEAFADIIVKTGHDAATVTTGPATVGREIVRIRDIGRVELGAKNADTASTLDGRETITIAIFQRPGSNAIATAERVRQEMERLAGSFPPGLEQQIIYDTTVFVEESIQEVVKTLFEAVVLVFVVVLLFLQNWRATLIPMLAVPVSLIGTFAVMAGLGFSLNNLSLFGLVLAIGIVVDDAIVVVENVERLISQGKPAREAARQAMREVSGALVAMTLVLAAVFVPTSFITGISGEFYRQFAITIAVSTAFSAINSLTLSPALAAIFFAGHEEAATPLAAQHASTPLPRTVIGLLGGLAAVWLGEDLVIVWAGLADAAPPLARWGVRLGVFAASLVVASLAAPAVNLLLAGLFRLFNLFFDVTTGVYSAVVGLFLRIAIVMIGCYIALMGLTYFGFSTVPVGFIPEQDKGYLLVNATLPEGASQERTARVVKRLEQLAGETPAWPTRSRSQVTHCSQGLASQTPAACLLCSTPLPAG